MSRFMLAALLVTLLSIHARANPMPETPSADAIFIRPSLPFPVPIINVQPAQVQVVFSDPPMRTIDIETWTGYHSGDVVRIATRHIIYVRPHGYTIPGNPPVILRGSAVAVWPEGVWFTRELPEDLTARLVAQGWGQSSSTLSTAPAAEKAEQGDRR